MRERGFTEPVPYLLKGERVLYEAVPSAASQTDPRQEAVRVEPARRIHGVVRHYSFQLGHGSIASDDGTRWFLHHANLLEEGYVDLSEGTVVHFIASEDEAHAWWWQGFFTEDDRAILDVASLPAPADYLDDPSALLITPEEVRSMRVDSQHILVDHAERLPARLRADPAMARKLLEGDLHQLADRVRRNYRLAVAQYYRGAVQLLLPLDLDEIPGERQLALVVERTESGARRASTVLGVDLAYRQARVVARADGEWLGRAWLAPDQPLGGAGRSAADILVSAAGRGGDATVDRGACAAGTRRTAGP